MALTVTIKSSQKNFLMGDEVTLTSTVTNTDDSPVPETLTYEWTAGDIVLESTDANLVITDAKDKDAVAYKVKVTDTASGSFVESNTVKLSKNEIVLTLDKHSQVVLGGTAEFVVSAETSYADGEPTPNYNVHYQWYKDDIEIPDEDISILTLTNLDDSFAGVYRLDAWGTSVKSKESVSFDLAVLHAGVEKELQKDTRVKIDHPIVLQYSVSEEISGSTEHVNGFAKTQSWYMQRLGEERPTLLGNSVGVGLNGYALFENGYIHKDHASHDDNAMIWSEVEFTQDGVSIVKFTSQKCTMEIVEFLYKLWRYVHPIPWRKTSFIYIGWWVFDEIVKMNEKGIDWREHTKANRYAKDLETIAAAEEKYGDCTCMESRNGFMYNASQLHHLDREIIEKVLRIRETPPQE